MGKMQHSVTVLQAFLTVFLLVAKSGAEQQVVSIIPVENPTYAEEYHCIVNPYSNTSDYSWHRHNENGLPEGVKAEGNKLHFMKSSPEFNGLYICTVENENGTAAGSLYRNIRDKEGHTEL